MGKKTPLQWILHPPGAWRVRAAVARKWEDFRRWFYRCVGRAASRSDPLAAAVLRESIHVRAKMDYKQRDIYMVIDSRMLWSRTKACKKEPETAQWIEQNMRPGDVFYDIGANVGAYSLVACAVARGECRILAFEPSFSTFASLNQNIFTNGFQKSITPFHMALADRTGLITLGLSSLDAGTAQHSFYETDAGRAAPVACSQAIMGYRLDDLVEQFHLPLPNLIKLDVDGPELQVIQGSPKVLAHPGLRTVLVEIHEEEDPQGKIVGLLAQAGLRVQAKFPRGGPGEFNYVLERTR